MGHDWEKVKDSDDIHLVGWVSDRRYGLQWRHMHRLQSRRTRNGAGKGLEKHITRSVEHLRDGCFEGVLFAMAVPTGGITMAVRRGHAVGRMGTAPILCGGHRIEKGRGSLMRMDNSTSSEPA